MLVLVSTVYARSPDSGFLTHGVVVDSPGALVFLREPGQLSARRIANGELVWSQADLIEPLGLHGDRLLVLGARSRRGQAVLYWLDPATGSIASEMDWSLPEGVTFLLEERPAETFSARSAGVDGEVWVSWEYLRYPMRGAPAISGVNRPPKAPRVSRPAESQGRANEVEMAEPDGVVRRTGIIQVLSDQVRAADTLEHNLPGLSEWQELAAESRHPDYQGRQFRSSRGGAILVSRLRNDQSHWLRYQWSLIDADGSVLGRTESPFSFAPFAVVDRFLLHVVSPYVRIEGDRLIDAGDLAFVVVNLADGTERWRINLLDFAHRDPLPP